MNTIPATIKSIATHDGICIVSFHALNATLVMMALEGDSAYQLNQSVTLGVQATKISIALRALPELSISNQVETTIAAIHMGELLCRLQLTHHDTTFEAIFTNAFAKAHQLQVGQQVTTIFKASDLFIVKALDATA